MGVHFLFIDIQDMNQVYHFTRISNLFGFQSQLTQLAKIEVVRFWIGLIRLFIDWPQHGEEPYYTLRTPKWAKNDN